jgi:hypothetical protein
MSNINETIGCVNHDCDKCKAVQEPWGYLEIEDIESQREYPHNCRNVNLWHEGGEGMVAIYTAPPAAQPAVPDFKAFKEWAAAEGYDVAYTHDGIKWICLNPMTADLWKTWQAATPPAPQPAPVKTYHDGKPWPVAPMPWVGLDEDEVEDCARGCANHAELARAIESKLKEKNT